MDEFKFSKKDLRKAAFAVGFGLTLGKQAAGWMEIVASTFFNKWMVDKAKNGDNWAPQICEKAGVTYKEDSEKEPAQ